MNKKTIKSTLKNKFVRIFIKKIKITIGTSFIKVSTYVIQLFFKKVFLGNSHISLKSFYVFNVCITLNILQPTKKKQFVKTLK